MIAFVAQPSRRMVARPALPCTVLLSDVIDEKGAPTPVMTRANLLCLGIRTDDHINLNKVKRR